jgi:ankyrin repeat protein
MSGFSGTTARQNALPAMSHDPEDLEQLLEKIRSVFGFTGLERVTPNSRGDYGRLPLSIVITWNDLHAMDMLIEAGADISARGEFGDTPLLHAIQMRHYEAAERLMELGADPNIRNDMGLSALEFARLSGDQRALGVLDRSGDSHRRAEASGD